MRELDERTDVATRCPFVAPPHVIVEYFLNRLAHGCESCHSRGRADHPRVRLDGRLAPLWLLARSPAELRDGGGHAICGVDAAAAQARTVRARLRRLARFHDRAA